MDKYMEIFEIKTPAKCAKVNASQRQVKRRERGLFESFGKTSVKQPKNWDIFDEPQRKIPA